MRRTLDALLPDGAIWAPVPGGDLDEFLDGLGDGLQAVYDTSASFAYVRDPSLTPFLDTLEREFGVMPNVQLTDAQRRATLALVKFQRNYPSSITTMQRALDRSGLGAGGYGLIVYANDPPVDPGMFTNRAFQTMSGGANAYSGYFTTGLPSITWTAIASNGTIFCAVGTNVCYTSSDGVNWTSQSIPAGLWTAIAWNGSVFCAVSSDSACATSPTGVTWTSRSISAGQWTGIVWAPALTLFVAVSNGGANACATSPTGTTWTPQSIPSGKWSAVCWSDMGLLCAVADDRVSGAGIATSTNATAWTQRTDPLGAGGNWSAVCWSSFRGIFLIVGSDYLSGSPVFLTSADGVSWSWASTMPYGRWRAIIWQSTLNLFVAVGDGPVDYCATSPDAITWTARQIPQGKYFGLAYCSGLNQIGALSQGGASTFSTSANAIQWAATGTIGAYSGINSGGLWIVNGELNQAVPVFLMFSGAPIGYSGFVPAGGGNSTALCGYYTGMYAPPVIIPSPTDPWTWPLVFFIAAGVVQDSSGYITSLTMGSIPQNLYQTYVEMVLRFKPMHTWCCSMVYQG
jgi:hypothetical protein